MGVTKTDTQWLAEDDAFLLDINTQDYYYLAYPDKYNPDNTLKRKPDEEVVVNDPAPKKSRLGDSDSEDECELNRTSDSWEYVMLLNKGKKPKKIKKPEPRWKGSMAKYQDLSKPKRGRPSNRDLAERYEKEARERKLLSLLNKPQQKRPKSPTPLPLMMQKSTTNAPQTKQQDTIKTPPQQQLKILQTSQQQNTSVKLVNAPQTSLQPSQQQQSKTPSQQQQSKTPQTSQQQNTSVKSQSKQGPSIKISDEAFKKFIAKCEQNRSQQKPVNSAQTAQQHNTLIKTPPEKPVNAPQQKQIEPPKIQQKQIEPPKTQQKQVTTTQSTSKTTQPTSSKKEPRFVPIVPPNTVLPQDVLDEFKALENFMFSDEIELEEQETVEEQVNATLQQTKIVKVDGGIAVEHNPVTAAKYIYEHSDSMDDQNQTIATKRQMFYAAKEPIKELKSRDDGSFFGLGNKVKYQVQLVKKIIDLYDWQIECLNLDAVQKRRNLVYALPTSGGKTLVAEILMLREIVLRNMNVIFVLPYVSIVQEKINDMLPFACEYDFFVEEYCSGKGNIPAVKRRKKNSIYVCTTEKANILIDSLIETNRIGEISLIVVDELHMIGDPQRGCNLELLLAKIIHLQHLPIQIVGMSATIANLDEIGNFLHADIYTRNFRPVELQEYVRVNDKLLMVDQTAQNSSEILKVSTAELQEKTVDHVVKRDPDLISPLIYENIRGDTKKPCLIFCSTKKNCESVALLLVDCFPKWVLEYKKKEREQLIAIIRADSNGNICPVLAKTILYGIAYHNSTLTNDERRHIEDAYRQGVLNVICCTSTLAAGVNLPAARVVIRSPYVGAGFIKLSEYKQMIGRAGRTGIAETGDSILFCNQKDYDRVVTMLSSSMDNTVSAYISRLSIVRTCILNLLGTKMCKTIQEILNFASCLLAHVQQEKHKTDMPGKFIDAIKELFKEGAIVVKTKAESSDSVKITVKVNEKDDEVKYDDELDISKLGRASVKAGVSLEDARSIERELKRASRGLVITECLHLLYVVAPTVACCSISPDFRTYSYIFMGLNKVLLDTARIIGVNEAMAMKMMRSPKFTEGETFVLKRLYLALILYDLWNGKEIYEVSRKYKVERGIVHKLMQMASNQAHTILKFCEEYEEFWVFKEILEKLGQRLTHCCSVELLPLMDLPLVKLGRARQLYNIGIRRICDVAGQSPHGLVSKLGNLNVKQACVIIRAAQYMLSEQMDDMRAQMAELAGGVQNAQK